MLRDWLISYEVNNARPYSSVGGGRRRATCDVRRATSFPPCLAYAQRRRAVRGTAFDSLMGR